VATTADLVVDVPVRDRAVDASSPNPEAHWVVARGNTLVTRFPKDFEPALALEDGAYKAAWSDVPLDESLEPATLAEASFEVSAP
jgi:hypothetical protein